MYKLDNNGSDSVTVDGVDDFGGPWSSIKKAGRGIAKGAKQVGKLAVAPIQLIANLSLALIMKAALPLARAVCAIPPHILQISATAAGQRADLVPLFCRAVKVKNWNGVRKMLPGVLKIALKASAIASVPGLAPALLVAKHIPGLKSFAGADDTYSGEMAGSGPLETNRDTMLLVAVGMMTTGLGLYGLLKQPNDMRAIPALGRSGFGSAHAKRLARIKKRDRLLRQTFNKLPTLR